MRCAVSPTAPHASAPGVKLTGSVHGGQQPIAGAHVYLFAANTAGYGQPSVSLLAAAATGLADSIGAFVTTDSNGGFTITGDYACTPNTQVYLYSSGGNPGAGINSAAGLLSALGNCPSSGSFLASLPFINVNEVTTVAAAYAMAGFAIDATHVSSSGTTLAQTGIANAFANAANLADITTGIAFKTTPAGNGTVPQAEIHTMADILASCINSTGPASSPCSTLLSSALSSGSSGTRPTDTATAAINIAHNPAVNVATLYALLPAGAPFQPTLAAAPNDFTVALQYTYNSFALNSSSGQFTIAVDGSGNVWIPNSSTDSVTELSSTGVEISPTPGYTGGGLHHPIGITIDDSGSAWVTNSAGPSITKLSNNGTAISPASGYVDGGLNNPLAVAIDAPETPGSPTPLTPASPSSPVLAQPSVLSPVTPGADCSIQ